MKKGFYFKMAVSNLRNHRRTVLPYLLASVCTVILFYIMYALSINPGIAEMRSGGRTLASMLNFGTVVIGIFSTIFLFYTNSFLIKRRKKELGLYNILGLEKKHIAKLLFFETLITSVVSLALGLAGGMLLSRLMFLLLLKLLRFPVTFRFEIAPTAILVTAVLFAAIFTLALLFNLAQIRLARPIELLKGSKVGEKEPKTRWLMALIGFGTLGTAYYLALTLTDPMNSIGVFFIAVLLVIVGTFCLFTAGSIAILKALRKNKKFYYNKKHFSAVSGMLYRMKQNASGLALICILSSAVLVTLSTTLSLNLGAEDFLRTNYPKDVELRFSSDLGNSAEKAEKAIAAALAENGLEASDKTGYTAYKTYFFMNAAGEIFDRPPQTGEHFIELTAMPLADYNAATGENRTLASDEALVCTDSENPFSTDRLSARELTLKLQEIDSPLLKKSSELLGYERVLVVTSDLELANELINGAKEERIDATYYAFFNLSGSGEAVEAFERDVRQGLRDVMEEGGGSTSVTTRASMQKEFYATYGGLFFVGILLGALFLMITVLIIYYKQVSEGYDDRERYEIMQKVGMSRREVKKTIKSQILMVFFLPLLAAFVHIAFAFNVVRQLLLLFSMTNTMLYIGCLAGTALVFAVIYTVVYLFTARVYYRITE